MACKHVSIVRKRISLSGIMSAGTSLISNQDVCCTSAGLAVRSFSTVNTFGSPLPAVISEAGWDGAWQKGVTPWDAGVPAPLIRHLASDPLLPQSGHVLVPGCGAGYDAVEWARLGRPTVGLDLSPTAITHALARVSDLDPSQSLPLTFQAADFFSYTHRPAFTVGWDYTFCGALPPAMWPAWAQVWKRLLTADGVLALLLFPVGQFSGGPPFAMDPPVVRAMLEDNGFETIKLEPVPHELSHKPRAGREYIGLFKPDKSRYPMINSGLLRYGSPGRARGRTGGAVAPA